MCKFVQRSRLYDTHTAFGVRLGWGEVRGHWAAYGIVTAPEATASPLCWGPFTYIDIQFMLVMHIYLCMFAIDINVIVTL